MSWPGTAPSNAYESSLRHCEGRSVGIHRWYPMRMGAFALASQRSKKKLHARQPRNSTATALSGATAWLVTLWSAQGSSMAYASRSRGPHYSGLPAFAMRLSSSFKRGGPFVVGPKRLSAVSGVGSWPKPAVVPSGTMTNARSLLSEHTIHNNSIGQTSMMSASSEAWPRQRLGGAGAGRQIFWGVGGYYSSSAGYSR